MTTEFTSLPFGSATVIAAATYGFVFWAAGGTLVTERELERDGWMASCEAGLASDVEASRASTETTPSIPNICGMMTSIDPGMQSLCPFILEPSDVLRDQQRRAQEAEDRRIADALEGTNSACSCAKTVYLEDRLPLAIYAGTGRLIVPHEVSNREAVLAQALRSPTCKMEG